MGESKHIYFKTSATSHLALIGIYNYQRHHKDYTEAIPNLLKLLDYQINDILHKFHNCTFIALGDMNMQDEHDNPHSNIELNILHFLKNKLKLQTILPHLLNITMTISQESTSHSLTPPHPTTYLQHPLQCFPVVNHTDSANLINHLSSDHFLSCDFNIELKSPTTPVTTKYKNSIINTIQLSPPEPNTSSRNRHLV